MREAYPMDTGPHARRDGLVVKTVGDEMLVYDLERHRAYCLNALAAAIWRGCDGRRPVVKLATAVRAETGIHVTDSVLAYGLASLGRARLLAGESPVSGLTRRQVLGGLGTAAIPVVLSIVAPTAAHAQSCASVGEVCLAGAASCCPGAGVCFDQSTFATCASGGPNCVCGFQPP